MPPLRPTSLTLMSLSSARRLIMDDFSSVAKDSLHTNRRSSVDGVDGRVRDGSGWR